MNRQNEDLGRVEEVVIDVINGRIAFLVLSFGGLLGVCEKLYAVPWKALYYEKEQQGYVLNVRPEQIDGAPGFEKEFWPAFTDVRWNRNVHAHYEVAPF